MISSYMSDYQKYIHLSRYSRFVDVKGRRETWPETVKRLMDFWRQERPIIMAEGWDDKLEEAILNLKVMPSMRTLMTAGEALRRDNVAGYNCSYTAIDGEYKAIQVDHPELDEPLNISISKPISFDEVMYILMCGTGAGFSVERQYINMLPKVGKKLNRRVYAKNNVNYPKCSSEVSSIDKKTNTIVVTDNKYGWSSALRILIVELYNGNFDIKWDTSQVRSEGERLVTFGGRASGPQPLIDLFEFTVGVFKGANGRKLTSVECHDITCKIAEVVVVGGVRRSALMSLSNLTDERMRVAKSGQWWDDNPQRRLANNSVCYTEKPDMSAFMKEFSALYASKSGERGIFNRESAKILAAKNGRRDPEQDFGTNPCSEILLRNKQFCNLTEVVVRSEDGFDTLKSKVQLATILGTLQASLTDFKYLSPQWKLNTEEEALLGVSLTGIMDHRILSNSIAAIHDDSSCPYSLEGWLQELKEVAVETNRKWADVLGIKQSTAITCVKPSGTVSQLVNSASGIHCRYSPYYIRTVRQDKKDPLAQLLIDQGVPYEEDTMSTSTWVFSFPIKSPTSSVMRDSSTAVEQLELWKIYQDHWCEHKPSITVYVRESEWMEVGAWVYKHFDLMSGVSFLPHSDHTYQQAPYQEITEEEYNELCAAIPKVDFGKLSVYETSDHTTGSQELACVAGGCDI